MSDMESSPEARKVGAIGWLGVAVGVAMFDYLAPETMTAAFRRGTENPHTRPLVLGAWALTTAHLIGALPEQVDPFTLIGHRGLNGSYVPER